MRCTGWTDVEEKADEFFEYLTKKNATIMISLLVKGTGEYPGILSDQNRWKKLRKLHVTEEYLSTQIPKRNRTDIYRDDPRVQA